jgi:hypothetical protein
MRSLTRITAIALAIGLIAGCTMIRKEEAHDTESTLAAAGFGMKPADTPAKLTKLQAMPVRKIVTRVKDGRVVYLYADPDFCKCLYFGNQEQYARYRQLAIEKQIAQEQIEAAQMNESAAMDWGMWGPFW